MYHQALAYVISFFAFIAESLNVYEKHSSEHVPDYLCIKFCDRGEQLQMLAT